MKPFIVVTDGFDKDLFSELSSQKDLEVYPKSKVSKDELFSLLPKANALVVRSATQVDRELLSKAPHLKYVVRAGEGTDNIDKLACQEFNVKVANTPGANNNSAAEHAIALMFTLLRHTARAHQSMLSGKWEKNEFMGLELTKKTLGIVGMGRIGRLVAQRLSGFEPQILFYDPFVTDAGIPHSKKVELPELFQKSDIITVHVPFMDSTKNLIDHKLLRLMKPQALLINAARGGIVVEEDLFTILSEKKIRGAALDVFAKEPMPMESPFRSLNNVILTPHLGASTEEAQYRVGEMAVHQLKEFFINHNLLNEVKA